MIEVRCKYCNQLLLKADLLAGAIKCHKCGMVFEYKVLSNVHLTNDYDPIKTKKVLSKKTKRGIK